MEWQDYDPSWLVDLAVQQQPTLTWLHDALRACTKAQIERGDSDDWGDIIYFVDRMEGKFWTNVILVAAERRKKIVLDILQDSRVGSISFMPLRVGTPPL